MQTSLFEPDYFISNHSVSEDITTKKKEDELLFPIDNCDGFFEVIQGRFRNFDANESNDSVNLNNLPECKTELRCYNVLGMYFPKKHHIEYYKQTPEELDITKIHERFHSIHHLTLDKNSGIWNDFAKTDSFYLELLAQLFTYIYLRDGNNPPLYNAFKRLNINQSFLYQTYKMFMHYGQYQAEHLYWIIREKNEKDPLFKALKIFERLFKQMTNKTLTKSNTVVAKNPNIKPNAKVNSAKSIITQTNTIGNNIKVPRIVPKTELRHFYRILTKLSFDTLTQRSILNDLLRKDNYRKLVELYNNSFKHVDKIYDNRYEPIFDNPNRKSITAISPIIKGTNDVISYFINNKLVNTVLPSIYNFEYIEREVSPLRTTKGIDITWGKASRSGTGGIDFIGWNITNNKPLLVEIKVNNDQNPFYALIQQLTYLSEISTPKQIERINKHHLFGNNHSFPTDSFYIYILSYRTKKLKGKYDIMLPATKQLAIKIKGSIQQIEEIVFLHMDPLTKIISVE
jgi:hypothetical protein